MVTDARCPKCGHDTWQRAIGPSGTSTPFPTPICVDHAKMQVKCHQCGFGEVGIDDSGLLLVLQPIDSIAEHA